MNQDDSLNVGFWNKYLWTPLNFSFESLKYGWDTFRAKVGFFLALTIAIGLFTAIPDYIISKVFDQGLTRSILELGVRLIGLLLGMITTRISLDFYDTGDSEIGKLTSLFPKIIPYVVGKLIYGFIVLSPMLVPVLIYAIFKDSAAWLMAITLIVAVPFVAILSYVYLYVGYLIVDRGLGPIEALSASKSVTSGWKWTLAIFSFVIAILNVLGVVCLLVGLLVTIPVTLMASVYVYRQLSPKAV